MALAEFMATIKDSLAHYSISTLSQILVVALGATVGLAVAWFAYRFIVRKVSGALKKGKI